MPHDHVDELQQRNLLRIKDKDSKFFSKYILHNTLTIEYLSHDYSQLQVKNGWGAHFYRYVEIKLLQGVFGT